MLGGWGSSFTGEATRIEGALGGDPTLIDGT